MVQPKPGSKVPVPVYAWLLPSPFEANREVLAIKRERWRAKRAEKR
jgi:hypothetical protein